MKSMPVWVPPNEGRWLRTAALLGLIGAVSPGCSDQISDGTWPAASGTVPMMSASTDPGAAPNLPPGSVDNGDGTATLPDGSVVPVPTTAGTEPSTVTPAPTAPATVDSPTPDGPGAFTCTGSEVVAQKRMVRLTFNQIANSLRSLLGDDLADSISVTFEIGDPTERTFPPLNSPREGSVIIDSQWQSGDAIAQAAAQHVFDNFTTVTGCADPATAECGQSFVTEFGERAFRRPLDAEEMARLLAVYTNAQTEGAAVPEAVQYAVYATLSAPQFLYRTEFGDDSLIEGPLSPYELASQISYFVTDGPPDTELLAAAAGGLLSTPDQVGAEVERLLQTEAARVNLQAAMYAYFGIPTLATIIVDPGVAPDFTEGMRASMMRESELFINSTLWNGSVQDLLLSRQSFANEALAGLYGVTVGAPVDEDGFGPITLPDNRSGIVTQAGFLTTRSSPDRPSVVRRGLLVNASLLCATNPPFPEDAELVAEIEEFSAASAALSEREKADQRATQSPCNSCHIIFDPYGLALDNFDVIGRYRETDPEGRPIDASTTLPSGTMITTPAQMAQAIVDSGDFANCMAKNLLAYALAEGAQLSSVSCSTKAISDAFATRDQSFGALVREVAVSQTFSVRSAGGAQQ